MAYPFPLHEQHKVYNNTFLQNTYAEIHFDKITESEWGNGERIKAYLNKYFHIAFDVKRENLEDGFSLSNKDIDVIFLFSESFMGVRVGREAYQSFAISVMPYVVWMKSFVKEVLQRDSVRSLVVRKINLWPYSEESANKRLSDENMLQTLLSSNLRNEHSEKKETDNGHRLDMVSFQEHETSLSLGYGVVVDEGDSVVVLDSKAVSEQTQPTSLNDVETKLDELDDILYSAYHWCVTEKVKLWMEGKEVEHV